MATPPTTIDPDLPDPVSFPGVNQLAEERPSVSISESSPESPGFGFILIGGALVGAQVRDVRLANELAERGYRVHVWWALDWSRHTSLHPEIQQHWLFHATRYGGYSITGVDDWIGRGISRLTSDRLRGQFTQASPKLLGRLMQGLVRQVCWGVELDRPLISRFARQLRENRITHLLPTLAILASFARAAQRLLPYRLRYLVTFQGYELYANYAREIGSEEALYRRLFDLVEDSDWPAIAVSPQYRDRICEEIGIPRSRLVTIPPGVPQPKPLDADRAQALVLRTFPRYRPDLPLIAYLGRRDSEKGIDLLLYAARILRQRGYQFQLAICGPTAFGAEYERACRQIAANLRCDVFWHDFVSEPVRAALLRASHCVVYPSIHAEPFGMVPVEAMAYGTPVVVPDSGGVSGLTRWGQEQGGLNFRSWDSGDLAEQLARLLDCPALRSRLAAGGPPIAEHYSLSKLGDRVLNHLGVANPSYSDPVTIPIQSQMHSTQVRSA